MAITEDGFSAMLDQTGLKLTAAQKSVLFKAYPMFRSIVDRAAAPMPREAEPSVIFIPEVR